MLVKWPALFHRTQAPRTVIIECPDAALHSPTFYAPAVTFSAPPEPRPKAPAPATRPAATPARMAPAKYQAPKSLRRKSWGLWR